jgi:hypothetical protein
LLLFIQKQSSTIRPQSFTAMEKLSLQVLDQLYNEEVKIKKLEGEIQRLKSEIEHLKAKSIVKPS